MDALDLFIGSEGTLGVIVEIETTLVPKPEGLLGGVVFFSSEEDLLRFVHEARSLSMQNRESGASDAGRLGTLMEKAFEVTSRQTISTPEASNQISNAIDARALEYFDCESLNFL